ARAQVACARSSNLKKDLTTKIDTLDIFQPRLATGQAGGLVMGAVGGPAARGAALHHVHRGPDTHEERVARWLCLHRSRRRLIPPKVFEPRRRQFRISNRVADIAMAKVILNGPRIVAIARELVSRTMPQHVCMNLKGQSRLLTRALHQPIEPIG